MKKVFFAIAMLAAGIFSANAQEAADLATLSLGEAVTVNAGETVTVEITLATNFVSDAFQLDVDLTEGLSFVLDNKSRVALTRGTAIEDTESFTLSRETLNSGSKMRVISYLLENGAQLEGITEAGGASLLSFQVVATATGTVSLSGIVITNCVNVNAKYSVRPTDAVTKTITVEEPTYYLAGDAAILPATGDDLIITTEEPKVFSAVDHLLAGTYNYSVTIGNEEGAETLATGTPLVIESNGKYDITYTLTQADGTYSITAVATRVDNATAIDELDAATAEKLLIDGQVIIRRNGIDYTVTGQKL